MPARLRSLVITMVLISLTAGLYACSGEPASASAGATSNPATTKGTLLFFMNPNGGPCRTQAGILEQMREDVEQYADIRYVQTNRGTDRDTFYQFGIRALPLIVLVDHQGHEIGRLSPGVQGPEQILAALKRK